MLVARKFGFHNRQCRLKRFSMFGSRLPLLYALHYVILVLVLPCSVKTDPKTENMSAVNEMAFQALIQGRASLDMNALRAQVANKNLWRADEEFSSIVGLLVSRFLDDLDSFPSSTPSICRQLKSQVYRSAPLDDIFFGVTASNEFGCRSDIPQSVINTLLDLIKRTQTEAPVDASYISTQNAEEYSFDTDTQSPADLAPWVGIYKAIAVLENVQDKNWVAEKRLFLPRLIGLLRPALLGETEELESSLVLESVDVFLSLATKERRDNVSLSRQEIMEMIEALNVWWARRPAYPTKRVFESAVHALAIDAMVRRFTKSESSPMLSWIANSVSAAADAISETSKTNASGRTLAEAALLLLSFTSNAAFQALIPLAPSDLKFHVGRASASIGCCEKTSNICNATEKVDTPLCVKVMYCPLMDGGMAFSEPRLQPRVSLLADSGSGLELTRLEADQGFSADDLSANGNRNCARLGTYRLPTTSTFQLHAFLLEMGHNGNDFPADTPSKQQEQKHHTALLTQSYVYFDPCIEGKQINVTRSVDCAVQHPGYSQLANLSPDAELAVNISNMQSLVFDLVVSDPTGDRMIEEPQLRHYAIAVGTAATSPAPEFVALLIEALNGQPSSQQPLYAATREAASRLRPLGAPSSTIALGTLQKASRASVYVIKLRMRQLDELLYLTPDTRLRFTVLVGSSDTGVRLRRELGTVNFSASKPSEFTRYSRNEAVVLEAPTGQFFSVLPSEAFWHPRPPIRHQFATPPERPQAMIPALFLILVVATPITLSLWLIPKTGLTFDAQRISVWEIFLLAYFVYVVGGLVIYWFKWRLLFYLKYLIVSVPFGLLIGHKSLVQRRTATYRSADL